MTSRAVAQLSHKSKPSLKERIRDIGVGTAIGNNTATTKSHRFTNGTILRYRKTKCRSLAAPRDDSWWIGCGRYKGKRNEPPSAAAPMSKPTLRKRREGWGHPKKHGSSLLCGRRSSVEDAEFYGVGDAF